MIKPMIPQNAKPFTLCCMLLIIISLTVPAYAEVISLKTDKPLYKKNSDTEMIFTGTAEEKDISEIVTVVIYDPGNNFVKPVHSGIVSSDKTFEVKISGKDFSKFTSHGIYNATAFMTYQQKVEGLSITFDFSLDGSPVYHPNTQSTPTSQSTSTPTPTPSQTTTPTQQSEDDSDGKSIQEKIQERIDAAKKQGSQTDTTDSTEKSIEDKIQERIDAAKKQDSTGGVKPTGNTTTPNEKPDPIGSNNTTSLDSSILYPLIGLGAAAAVGITVYGMKHKPKFMTREVSENVSTEQIQHTDSTTPHEEDYALMILKNRLAKGEITVEEFNELKRALQES